MCEADKEWVNREDKNGVRKWISATQSIEEVEGVTAIVAGGHFDGSMILHYRDKIFIADTMMTAPVSSLSRISQILCVPRKQYLTS